MTRKFVTLAEAAEQLGISPDAVNELRQQGDLYGYRDGTSWKFKPEDVDRVAENRSAAGSDGFVGRGLSGDSHEISEVPMDLPIDPDDTDDSGDDVVLLSEFELGGSNPSASATVIGQPGMPLSSFDSDVRLVSSDDAAAGASKTMIGLPGTPLSPGESAVKLETTGSDEASTSRTFIGTPGLPLSPDDSAIRVQSGGASPDSPSSTVIGKPGQPLVSGRKRNQTQCL